MFFAATGAAACAPVSPPTAPSGLSRILKSMGESTLDTYVSTTLLLSIPHGVGSDVCLTGQLSRHRLIDHQRQLHRQRRRRPEHPARLRPLLLHPLRRLLLPLHLSHRLGRRVSLVLANNGSRKTVCIEKTYPSLRVVGLPRAPPKRWPQVPSSRVKRRATCSTFDGS